MKNKFFIQLGDIWQVILRYPQMLVAFKETKEEVKQLCSSLNKKYKKEPANEEGQTSICSRS